MNFDSPPARRLRSAFPSALAADVDVVTSRIHPAKNHDGLSPDDIGALTVRAETLGIPDRVYFPEVDSLWASGLSPQQELIADCLFTRHVDGYIRERFLKKILFAEPDWVAPYVVQLVGEYVINIVSFIADHLEELDKPGYWRFAAENPRFLALTRDRVASYWDCYHRHPYRRLADYPGTRIMNFLESLPRADSE